MRVAIYTLGCKVNQYETQAMEQELQRRGHTLVDFESPADAYIINTCSVTAVSDKKSRQMIRRAKSRNPQAVVAACGCYVQTHTPEAQELGIDLIGGTGDRMEFLTLLEQAAEDHRSRVAVDEALRRRNFEVLPAGGMAARTRAMLKVEDGCVNFCTYCIIPYARGPVRSLPLEEAVRQTEQLRRQFVSDASHELRTPLAAMRLLSDSILQNDMDQETVREFVQDISGEADRLTRMTSKLLNLTALDSRQFTPTETEPVNLGACCKKAVRMLGPYAAEMGAQIEQSSEENCYVLAREDDIFQLVLNLAENGVKYSQKDGQVRLIAYSQGSTAVLIVEDNGVGIPEDELERIFQRFYRVDKARSREAGGTGLGLAIVQETAEKFGGTVTAANRPQGGARFTVQFPLYQWEGEP